MRISMLIFIAILGTSLSLLIACSAPTVNQPTKPVFIEPVQEVFEPLPDLPLPPAPVILFAFDSSKLSPRAQEKLSIYVDQLGAVNALIVYAQGHTDPRGSDQYNMKLGQRRANAVASFLRHAGYRGSIKTTSYGEKMLSYHQSNDEAHRRNRRVEILITP